MKNSNTLILLKNNIFYIGKSNICIYKSTQKYFYYNILELTFYSQVFSGQFSGRYPSSSEIAIYTHVGLLLFRPHIQT